MKSIATDLRKCSKTRVLSLILGVQLAACGGGNSDLQSQAPTISPAPINTNQTKIETFAGKHNQYQILQTASGFAVRAIVGNEGSREVVGITALQFSDLKVNLQIGDQAKTITDAALRNILELYVAFFNRVPDADGLAYWIRQYRDGTSIGAIADNFYQAALLVSFNAAPIIASKLTAYSESL